MCFIRFTNAIDAASTHARHQCNQKQNYTNLAYFHFNIKCCFIKNPIPPQSQKTL